MSDYRLFETHPECKDVFFLFRDVEDLERLRSSRELRAHGLRSVSNPEKVNMRHKLSTAAAISTYAAILAAYLKVWRFCGRAIKHGWVYTGFLERNKNASEDAGCVARRTTAASVTARRKTPPSLITREAWNVLKLFIKTET